MDLFEELIKDEEGHIDFIETQLDLMAQIGKENYGQLQADSADEIWKPLSPAQPLSHENGAHPREARRFCVHPALRPLRFQADDPRRLLTLRFTPAILAGCSRHSTKEPRCRAARASSRRRRSSTALRLLLL